MKKWKKLLLPALMLMTMLLFSAINVSAVSYKAGGTCGDDARWYLDYEGNLHIYGEGAAGRGAWGNYEDEIKNVVVEEGITSISDICNGFNSLKTVKLPKTLQEIGGYSFRNCTALETIDIPKGVKWIGRYAFDGCSSLKKVTLPSILETIGYHAFSHTGLTTITTPSSVKTIDEYAFASCPNLQSANINGTNLDIDGYAFEYCPRLHTVKFGDGVIEISTRDFQYCTALKNVTFGKKLWQISREAFRGCSSLTEITLPDSLICVGMVESSWGGSVFEDCTALKKVTFGKNVQVIEENSFNGCTSLKEIYFCGDVPSGFDTTAFKNCGYIKAYYPKGSSVWSDPSVLHSYGAARIDWNEWTVPLNHFAVVQKNLTTTSKGLKVSWNKLSGAKGYEIWRKQGNSSWTNVQTIYSGSTVSWTDTSVKNGQRYTYRIYAINGSVKSVVSNYKYKYYLSPNTVSIQRMDSKIKVSWKKNSSATGYQIQYATNSRFSGGKYVNATNYKILSKAINTRIKGYNYIRVRSYKKVNGVIHFSAWSGAKRIYIE